MLSTVIVPSYEEINLKVVARPSPDPCPISLVVKKGLKICERSSGFIPQPVSVTFTFTFSPNSSTVKIIELLSFRPFDRSSALLQ